MCTQVCGGDIPWGMEDLGLGANLCMPQHVTIFPWLIGTKCKWEEKIESANRISIAGLPALSCSNSVINLLRLMTQMRHMALLILSLNRKRDMTRWYIFTLSYITVKFSIFVLGVVATSQCSLSTCTTAAFGFMQTDGMHRGEWGIESRWGRLLKAVMFYQ